MYQPDNDDSLWPIGYYATEPGCPCGECSSSSMMYHTCPTVPELGHYSRAPSLPGNMDDTSDLSICFALSKIQIPRQPPKRRHLDEGVYDPERHARSLGACSFCPSSGRDLAFAFASDLESHCSRSRESRSMSQSRPMSRSHGWLQEHIRAHHGCHGTHNGVKPVMEISPWLLNEQEAPTWGNQIDGGSLPPSNSTSDEVPPWLCCNCGDSHCITSLAPGIEDAPNIGMFL